MNVKRREFLDVAIFAAGGTMLPALAASDGFSVPPERVVPYFGGGWKMYMFSNRTIDIMLSTLFRSPSGKLVMVDGGWAKDGEFLLPVLKQWKWSVDYVRTYLV